MDQTRKDKDRYLTKQVIAQMSLDELSYTLGRYCGPSNAFLCQKHYGHTLVKEVVEERIYQLKFEKDLEEEFLSS